MDNIELARKTLGWAGEGGVYLPSLKDPLSIKGLKGIGVLGFGFRGLGGKGFRAWGLRGGGLVV